MSALIILWKVNQGTSTLHKYYHLSNKAP